MSENTELKPCPFCGGKAYLFVESDNDNPFASNDECNYYWQVKHNCNMSDDTNHYFIDSDFLCFRTPWFKDRQKAIDVWNRRTNELCKRCTVMYSSERINKLQAENAKLREVVADMLHDAMENVCFKAYWCDEKNWQTCNDKSCGNHLYVDMARELGIGVDE